MDGWGGGWWNGRRLRPDWPGLARTCPDRPGPARLGLTGGPSTSCRSGRRRAGRLCGGLPCGACVLVSGRAGGDRAEVNR